MTAPPGRDADRGRVYEAEGLVRRLLERPGTARTVQVAGSTVDLPAERRFASVESAQRYVDAVLALPAVVATWPERAATAVRVRRRRGTASAHYEYAGAVIAVPDRRDAATAGPWALRELVLLHELAHHLTGDAHTAHGREFRLTMLDVTELALGPELALLLRVSYADQGLR